MDCQRGNLGFISAPVYEVAQSLYRRQKYQRTSGGYFGDHENVACDDVGTILIFLSFYLHKSQNTSEAETRF